MKEKHHHYKATIEWTGNKGKGTDSYVGYERSHSIHIGNKVVIAGSSDTAFRGDAGKHTPEDLFLSSLSACHMLWYLHLCAEAGVVVTAYTDNATGTLLETSMGGGHFMEVVLHPLVSVQEESMMERANELHEVAHELCFIANSVNFPVRFNPLVQTGKPYPDEQV